MITGEYETMNQLAQNNLCTEHEATLTVVHHPTDAVWCLRCGHGHFPETITKIPSLSSEVARSTDIPPPVAGDNHGGHKRKSKSETEFDPTSLMPAKYRQDIGDKKDLSPAQIRGLIDYAQRYDLDAYRGHVVMMYGEPYIGLDGYIYHANREKIPFSLGSYPLTEHEREDYKVGPNDHAWIAILKRLDTGATFIGIGIVTEEEMKEEAKGKPGQKRYPVVAAKPQQMVQKRAEWQALRRGVPIGGEDGGDI